MIIRLLVFSLCFSVAIFTYAQPDYCAIALTSKAFDRTTLSHASTTMYAVRDDICSREYSSVEQARSRARSAGFSAVYNALPISGNAGSSSTGGSISIDESQFCRASSTDLETAFGLNYTNQVGTYALDAWRECVRTTRDSSLWVEYELFEQGSIVAGDIIKTANTGELNSVITAVTAPGRASNQIQCQIGESDRFNPQGVLDTPIEITTTRTAFSCVKQDDTGVVITIQTRADSLPPINLPSAVAIEQGRLDRLEEELLMERTRISELPFATAPVGTIIASALNYNDFSLASGNQVPFNPTTSIWAPADGRLIQGSKLSEFYQSTPDLRGQFLRGFNEFSETGAPDSIANGLDDGTRDVVDEYSYQQGSSGEHTHEVEGEIYDVSRYSTDGQQNGVILQERRNYTDYGSYTEPTVGGPSDGGTRPPNAAVHYYIRINP